MRSDQIREWARAGLGRSRAPQPNTYYLYIRCYDSGTGIDPESDFERFSEFDDSSKNWFLYCNTGIDSGYWNRFQNPIFCNGYDFGSNSRKKGFITPLTGTEKLFIYCRKLFISANPIGLQYVCAYWLRLIMRVAVKVATEESKWFEFWLVCSSAKFLDCHARSREHFSLRVQALRCVRPTATVHDIKSI